jgi:hypothetical protein
MKKNGQLFLKLPVRWPWGAFGYDKVKKDKDVYEGESP